jgi:biotin transporter BioY
MEYVLGAAFQWLRAQKKVSELWTVLAIIVAGGLGYWLSDDFAWHGVRAFFQSSFGYMSQFIVANQLTSIGANVAVTAIKADPKSPFVPVTDSKGA